MEIILELLFEIIIEGTFELCMSKKVILPIRILLLILLVLIYGAVLGVIAMVGIGMWKDGNVAVALMMLGIDVFLAVVIVYGVVRQYKKKYKEKE